MNVCHLGSSTLSLPPHKQKETGSILGGDTNICCHGLYLIVPKTFLLNTSGVDIRKENMREIERF